MAAARNLEIEARAKEAARHSTTISPANCRLLREYARRRGSNKNGATEKDQMKRDETLSSNPIARKLVASLRRSLRGKVVNIGHVIKARAAAEDLQGTVVTADRLADFHPAHAAYVYTQNQVSVLAEQITALKELAPFAAIISKAEDLYNAELAADEPADDILLHVLGVLRRLRGSGEGDHRNYHFGVRRRVRH